MIPNLSLSGSSSASTGPFKSGDVGGQSFNFGGINTGGGPSMWIIAGVAGAVIVGAVWYLRRKK